MGRSRWASNTVFLLAAIGSAVGLGNVWRFPYLAYKYGGGAFLIPYLIALFIVGVPLLMLEFAVGQKTQAGAVKAFRSLHHRFGGLGIFALLSSFIIVCYYAVVMAWSLIYFLVSFAKHVPWAGNSEGYFYKSVLELTANIGTIGGINWTVLLALIAIWVLIYFSVWKGVHSVGKVVWWTVPLPVILLGVLLIRGMTLPGFLTGWVYYLKPKWGALLDPQVWQAAFGQIMFTLTLAFGVMVAYASYRKHDEDINKGAWVTALVNSGISLFAGFVVFAILGAMANLKGVGVSEVVKSGPGLAFVVFPEALSLMPFAWFFSALFFLTLLTLGIDSAFSLVEAVNAAIHDRYARWNVPLLSLIVCALGFLGGIIFTTRAGLYFLDIVDHFVNAYNLLIVAFLQTILVGWVYGAEKLRAYMNKVSHWDVGAWWTWSIKVVSPLIILALLVWNLVLEVEKPYGDYPLWALSIGWAVTLVPFLIFLFFFVRGSKTAA
ncbi:sodium-dependent transporter [Candidatus Woesearchaeota archaeon]|nr:MAG: sodium-dependent transporter [Candidatus Woesearchaeota archaeon]